MNCSKYLKLPCYFLTTNDVLDVSPAALSVSQFRDDVELMHMLFSLEDLCGLTVRKSEDGIVLYIDPRKGRDAASLYDDIAV